MSYRKGEDTPARKRRRLPHKVVIERTDPFRTADMAELEAECRCITNGAEFYHHLERFGDVYWHVVRFGSEHQAEAFRVAAHRCDFARRPGPRFGPPAEERAAFREAALLWGLRTGAIRRVLQAWRNTQGSLTQQWSAAQQMLAAYRMPQGHDDIAAIFLDWARENHWHWLHRQRHPGWLPFDEFHWVMPQEAYPHSDGD
jgi:hypothetical protein